MRTNTSRRDISPGSYLFNQIEILSTNGKFIVLLTNIVVVMAAFITAKAEYNNKDYY